MSAMEHTGRPHTNFLQANQQSFPKFQQQSHSSWTLPSQMSSASNGFSHHHLATDGVNNPMERRGVIKETDSIFTIVVDVHDFNPEEISVQIVDNASAAILKGEHGKLAKNKNEEFNNMMFHVGEAHSESRFFSERYSLPPDLNMGTFRWDFPDKNHLRIMAEKTGYLPPQAQTMQQAIHQRQLQQQQQQQLRKSQMQPPPFCYSNVNPNSIMRYYGNNGPMPNSVIRNGFQRYGYNIGNHQPGHQHYYFRKVFP